MERYVIWGTGVVAQQLFSFYEKIKDSRKREIIAFVDNNKRKWGISFNGINVIAPLELKEYEFDFIDIWVYGETHKIIEKQIFEELGISRKNYKSFYEDERRGLISKYENVKDIFIKDFIDIFKGKVGLSIYNYESAEQHFLQEVFWDEQRDMSYIMFKGNKKMYLARNYPIKVIDGKAYADDFLGEQDSNSPHLYEYGEIVVKHGDVVVDAGAAEGNFALSHIDEVSKIYLIECCADWVEALKYTFEPYKDKVVICDKYLSNVDSSNTIRLDSLISEKVNFIKMDIEGEEINALMGCDRILKESENLKCAICSYHKHNDENNIKNLLEKYQMKVSTSKGYMWFFLDQYALDNYELRHGIVRGIKYSKKLNV